jgi:hypothetical protein
VPRAARELIAGGPSQTPHLVAKLGESPVLARLPASQQ